MRAVMILMAMVSIAGSVKAADYEVVASLPKATPPGNIAIGPKGRIFLSVHGFYGPKNKIVELLEHGQTVPYPNETWQDAALSTDAFNGVLGLNVDREGILWMLDGQSESKAGRLIGWDTVHERLFKSIELAKPVIRDVSFLNDLAIDRTHGKIYVSDTAAGDKAALIVVDIASGEAKRVLEGTAFTVAEDIDMVIDGKIVQLGGKPARIGVNPITIDPQDRYVYFGAMSGTKMYRIATLDLINDALNDEQLAQKVELYGQKPISDGITVDGGGNVYVTSITDDSIGVLSAKGEYRTLFADDALSWPDGLAYGPDHKMYATINELHRSPVLNNGKDGSLGEFKIIAFDALVKGASGR